MVSVWTGGRRRAGSRSWMEHRQKAVVSGTPALLSRNQYPNLELIIDSR